MSLLRKLMNLFGASPAAGGVHDRRRSLAGLGRNPRGQPRQVEYFHQVDDPDSHLACQTLQEFGQRHKIHLTIHLVTPLPGETGADREQLLAQARIDASVAANRLGLSFHDPGTQPTAQNCRRASEIFAANLAFDQFCELAPRVGNALWQDDTDAILDLSNEFATASEEEVIADCERGSARRAKLGEDRSATFYFGGKWYQGVDGLRALEDRLREDRAPRDTQAEPTLPTR